MALCRAFAKIEAVFLPRYYSADLLCDENIQLLPSLHRFGWYCGKAFWALDAGDSAAYVRLLRQGLESCAEAKPMAEFLLKQLEDSRRVQATPELIVLAEQVRTLLAQYPADDPAVEALKQSAAYQKVAMPYAREALETGSTSGVTWNWLPLLPVTSDTPTLPPLALVARPVKLALNTSPSMSLCLAAGLTS